MIKGYFDTIPASMEESARIDGASPFQTFVRILLPVSAPIFAVVFILYPLFTQCLSIQLHLQCSEPQKLGHSRSVQARSSENTKSFGVILLRLRS